MADVESGNSRADGESEMNGANGSSSQGTESKPLPADLDKRSLSMSMLETVDLEKDDLDYVMACLKTSPEGLKPDVAAHRLAKFGPNALPEKKVNPILEFLMFMWNPLSWVMEAAALVAIFLTIPGGKTPDWEDFVGIILLLLINATIGYIEERNAGNAVKALMDALAPRAKVQRAGEWLDIEAKELVIGDIVSLKLGDIIPADARIMTGKDIKIDQAALTGESLPVGKEKGDIIYSGSVVKQGEFLAVVVATGMNTFFGKAAHLVNQTESTSHLQAIVSAIGLYCMAWIGTFVLLLIVTQWPIHLENYRHGINNILVLLIGGVPIAMPVVLSVTLAIGAHELAEHKAIVTRMTAVEELAGMTVLCSDKTGTLTLNKLTIDQESFFTMGGYTVDQCMVFASRASRIENQDAIDFAVVNSLPDPKMARDGIEELDFHPFNPVDKRTEITYRDNSDGKVYKAAKGAPQIILGMAHNKSEIEKQVHEQIEDFAKRGFRALGIAIAEVPSGDVHGDPGPWTMVGLMPIFDPPRHDTKETIEQAIAMGVEVKMITGDQLAIAKETARRLGMGTNIFNTDVLNLSDHRTSIEYGGSVGELVESADGFAGVFPEHKYRIVEVLQRRGHMVGMTGDGVNDAPALKKASVGIAVAGATDAARGAADIVLTEPGLSVIIHAMVMSRQIFQRMKNYSMYACSVTVRIVVTFAVLVWAFRFSMPPFMVLILAYLNDGTIMAISKDRVNPSPVPQRWDLKEVFIVASSLGLYLTASTVIFYVTLFKTQFWHDTFKLGMPWLNPRDPNYFQLHSIIYLQASIIGQALIFVTRAHWFFFMDRPGLLLMGAFVVAQLVATFITVYANWGFTQIQGTGWGWAAVVWVWDIVWYAPLDIIKIVVRSIITGDKTPIHKLFAARRMFTFDYTKRGHEGRVPRNSLEAAQARASVHRSMETYRASLQKNVNSLD
jgi:H+-transporting ATPase